MSQSLKSNRPVFRRIARQSHVDYPVYDSTPLYDRTSLAGLESDIRVVSATWFRHDSHVSVEEFVCELPLAYFRFNTHDCYGGLTRYEMDTLFRVFVLKELNRWDHKTPLVEYLGSHPKLSEGIGLDTVPDQSTLWRSWNQRFTTTFAKPSRPLLERF